MRIFFIARGYPSLRDPQWGCFEREQAEALTRIGHEVVMLSVDGRYRIYWRKIGVTKIKRNGVVSYNLFLCPGKFVGAINKIWSQRFKEWQMDRLFQLAVKEFGMPDILYGHYLPNSEAALVLKRKYSIPAVGIEHWSKVGQTSILDYVKKQAIRTYQELDALIVVSNDLRNIIKENFGVDAIVVHNMVGNEFYFTPMKKKSNQTDFVAVGNLLPIKGYDLLITAFEHANLRSKEWSLTIVGDGPEHTNLQKMIDEKGLGHNIHLLGRKQKNEVCNILQNSDVFIVSSHTETFGVAAIEALACGLPVISTDCGGPRDFITENNGIMCRVNDIDALADKILFMHTHFMDYDRKKISDQCKEKFSTDVIAKQLIEIFETVVNRNK